MFLGLCHPCTTTADGQYLPDFQHRYLREDVPYGLVVVRGVAEIAGVSTPVIDDVLMWAQHKLGKMSHSFFSLGIDKFFFCSESVNIDLF